MKPSIFFYPLGVINLSKGLFCLYRRPFGKKVKYYLFPNSIVPYPSKSFEISVDLALLLFNSL